MSKRWFVMRIHTSSWTAPLTRMPQKLKTNDQLLCFHDWCVTIHCDIYLCQYLWQALGRGGGELFEDSSQSIFRAQTIDTRGILGHVGTWSHRIQIGMDNRVRVLGLYGRVVRWTFGVLEVPGWNPARVGASCRSRATSWGTCWNPLCWLISLRSHSYDPN